LGERITKPGRGGEKTYAKGALRLRPGRDPHIQHVVGLVWGGNIPPVSDKRVWNQLLQKKKKKQRVLFSPNKATGKKTKLWNFHVFDSGDLRG